MSNSKRWSVLNTSFLLGTLGLALVLVPLHLWNTQHLLVELVVCLGMVFAIGTAISAGYHRLFSHRAYRARTPLRFLLLCFGAAAFENSVLKWASDHRIHHRCVDTDKDPYRIQGGFWFAHWVWVMEDKAHPIEGVTDLEQDPLIRWQHRHHFLIGAVVATIPLWIGLATGNFWGHFVMGLVLRIVLTHHTTFLINSAAHVFGTRPYTDANSARDNVLLAPLTYGEGFHNFHHMWQWDYRNGVRWYHWDSTKWLIRLWAWTGLASGLRRVSDAAVRRAKLAMEAKALQARVQVAEPRVAEALRQRIAETRERVDQTLANLQVRREAWEHRRAEWKAHMALRRAEFQEAWKDWKALRLEIRRARMATLAG